MILQRGDLPQRCLESNSEGFKDEADKQASRRDLRVLYRPDRNKDHLQR